jgi:hypothetical protein
VVLWEALTGRRLFLGRTDFETMQNVLSRPIPPPSLLRPDIPLPLDRIVVRALERDRERRYAGARPMADDLEAVMQDLRYRSDAIPHLLADLFGREENTVQLTPPQLPAVDINALGGMGTSASHSTKRDRARAAGLSRRQQFMMVGVAAVLGALAFGLGSLWERASRAGAAQNAPQTRIVSAAR